MKCQLFSVAPSLWWRLNWLSALLALVVLAGCGAPDRSASVVPTISMSAIATASPDLATFTPATLAAPTSVSSTEALPAPTLAIATSPTAAPTPSPQMAISHLAFQSGGIHTINSDGSNLTRLTDSFRDRLPAWSPDGERIAFSSDRDDIGNPDIYVINADGTGSIRLTNEPSRARDDTPFWSPDGQQIAFTSNRDSTTPYGDIYIMRTDGTQVQRVTTDPTFENIIGWSPDSRRIYYSINHEGAWTIHVVDLDGTHDTVIVDGAPGVLSPDGTAIAYIGPDASQNTVWVSNVDGTNTRRLVNTPGTKYSPTWAPDGKRIAFSPGLAVINIDGTGQTYLSDPQTHTGEIHWSPDGKQIAFQASNANDEMELAVVDVTTGTVKVLTPGRPVEAGFAWAPQ